MAGISGTKETGKMRVWLDDERPMPEGFDTHVKTADEAITLLKTGNVTAISLDHDLGLGKNDYNVACWIEIHAMAGTLKPIDLFVHTANPVGERNIWAALRSAMRYWRQNDNESR
jgi:hypothetical protein